MDSYYLRMKKKKIVYTRDEYHLSRTSINRESVEKEYLE